MNSDFKIYSQSPFFPRFLVQNNKEKLKNQSSDDERAVQASSQDLQLAIKKILQDFVDDIQANPQGLSFLCFEAVVEKQKTQTMLDNLSQAIGFKTYKTYVFPESKQTLWMEEIKKYSELKKSKLEQNFICFDPHVKDKTFKENLATSKWIHTYSLQSLIQNIECKKELWNFLKKDFNR